MEASERRVAVVGDDGRASTLRDAVEDAGGRLTNLASDDAGPVASDDADSPIIVAVGDEAIRDAAVSVPDGTIVPVADRRLAFDREGAVEAIRGLLGASSADEPIARVEQPIVAVTDGANASAKAVFDVALVTSEPARISEFAVGFPERQTESVRADGVVVATPLGSEGYANAVGGPIVESGGGLPVAPIAPFNTRTDTWVTPDRVEITVERESEPVALVIDGDRRDTVAPHQPIAIETVDRVTFAAPTAAHERVDRKHSNNS